jgi:hypothetical protein
MRGGLRRAITSPLLYFLEREVMFARRTFAIISVALAFGVTACSSGSVSTSDLEDVVSTQLEATVGQAPDSVDCPEELPAEVGSEVRCTLTTDDTTFGLTLTVTSVEDDVALFDIAVDETPEG